MKRESAPLMLRAVSGSLVPASPYDADLLTDLPRGVDLEVTVKHRKRSVPQLRAYWAGLHGLVKATERFPSAEHAHEAIKIHLGYVTPLRLLDGREVLIPDSAAFASMDADEFKGFLDRAQKLCLELFGIDIMTNAERSAA